MVDVWESVLYSVAHLLKLYQKLEFMVFQLIIANLSTTNRGVNNLKWDKQLNKTGLHTSGNVLIEIIFSQCGYFVSVNCPKKFLKPFHGKKAGSKQCGSPDCEILAKTWISFAHALFPFRITVLDVQYVRVSLNHSYKRVCCYTRNKPIGGFHVTQVSLIITQVKNKIAYYWINWARKLKYRGRVINKQRAKVSGMYVIQDSSYSTKSITANYSV